MSHHVVSEVYKREVGKMPRVAVLALMADKASDDGRGIWASKQTLADELGCTKQTMLTIIDSLIEDGLLVVVGEQRCANGYTVEYRIDIDALEALPLVGCHERRESRKLTGQKSRPVKSVDPTGQKSGPHRSKDLTLTTLEPPLNLSPPTPRDGGKRGRTVMDADWQVPAIADLTPNAAAMAVQWPSGAYQAEGEAFRNHWIGTGRAQANWAARWCDRVIERHAAIMRAGKAGVTFPAGRPAGDVTAPRLAPKPPSEAKRHEDERSEELHAALREALGDALWEDWIAPCALILVDDQLTVAAPSRFASQWVEQHQGGAIGAALAALGWHVDRVRHEVVAPKRRKVGAK